MMHRSEPSDTSLSGRAALGQINRRTQPASASTSVAPSPRMSAMAFAGLAISFAAGVASAAGGATATATAMDAVSSAVAMSEADDPHLSIPVVDVDYFAELNAPVLALPEGDRAWPLYREALLPLCDTNDFRQIGYNPIPDEFSNPRQEAEWLSSRTWVENNIEAVNKLREATRKPHLGYLYAPAHEALPEDVELFRAVPPNDPGPPRQPPAADTPEGSLARALIDLRLPVLRPLETGSRALQVHAWMQYLDAREQFVQGGESAVDPALATGIVEDIAAVVRLGMHLMDQPIVSMQTTGFRIYNRALGQALIMLQRHPEFFSDEDLSLLSDAVGSVNDDIPDLTLDAQRLALLDLLERTYTGQPGSNGVMTVFGAELLARHANLQIGMPEETPTIIYGARPEWVDEGQLEVQALIADDRQTVLDRWKRANRLLEARMEKPLWERGPLDIEIPGIDPYRTRFDVAEVVGLGTGFREEGRALVQMRRDSLLVLLAMLQSRREDPNGNWPTSLEELVPKWLDAVPMDLFTGKPMLYIQDEVGNPTLYSRGADYDDDGGVLPDRSKPRDQRDAGRWVPRAEAEARADDPTFPHGDLLLIRIAGTRIGAVSPVVDTNDGSSSEAGDGGGADEIEVDG